MLGRLSVFQKTMLEWNKLHPYNAVHVVRISEALELERLQRHIAATLEAQGLTGLTLNRGAGTFEYQGGSASAELRSVGCVQSVSGLAEEIEHQLNTPFPENERLSPFRFFVAEEPEGFAFGLVYFHVMADAESILLLLKEVAASYVGRDTNRGAHPVERYPPRRDNLLRHHPGVLARRLGGLPSEIRQMRGASRPHYRNPGDFTNKYGLFTLGADSLSGLAQMAKGLNVTLNDLFLALLMQCVSGLDSYRLRTGRRRGISLGCVVNIRKDLDLASPPPFGVLLGFFVVRHALPDGMGLAELARDIGRQTQRIKQRRLYLGAPLDLALGRLGLSLFSAERRKSLYQKHYPLWGGLSNMDLNPFWPEAGQGQVKDYFRAVSTGPVTPLVLSITTTGSRANIGVTYRPTVFSESDIAQVRDGILEAHKGQDR